MEDGEESPGVHEMHLMESSGNHAGFQVPWCQLGQTDAQRGTNLPWTRSSAGLDHVMALLKPPREPV